MSRAILFSLAASVALTGCASVDPTVDFNDVAHQTEARTGHQIAWRQNKPEDKQVDDAVALLLKRPLRVGDAVQIALLNNQGLQATYEEIGISQADLVQAGLLKNPDFSGVLRFPNEAPSLADLELSVAQDFLDLFTLPMRQKIAAAELEKTKLRVGQEVVTLAAEVKKAFYTLQAEEELLKRLKLVLDINQSGADLAAQQHQAGTVNEIDQQNQLMVLNENKVAVDQAKAEIAADREGLNRLLGLAGAQIEWTIADELPAVPESIPSAQRLETLALAQRFDVAAARQEVEQLRQTLKLAGGTALLPGGVNVGGDTEKNPDGSRVSGPTLSLQVPVFDQGQAQVAKARATERAAQDRLNQLSVNARSEVREARDRLLAAHEMAQFYQNVMLPQRAKVLELTQQQYNYMLKGTYDLIEAKERELQTERARVEACRDYWLAFTNLELAVGGTMRDLGADKTEKKP